MKKMKWMNCLLAGALMMPSAAFASELEFTGSPCPLPIVWGADGEVSEDEISSIRLLGVSDGSVIVYMPEERMAESEAEIDENAEDTAASAESTDAAMSAADPGPAGRVGYVTLDDFTMLAPTIQIDSLPNAETTESINQGASGDGAKTVQEQLISLGYLSGEADGLYGGGTASSVSAFQESYGLPKTGNADAPTQWLLAEVIDLRDGAAGEVLTSAYPPVYTVEDKFASILDKVAVDLEAFTDPAWKFSYDSMEGEGLLSNGTHIGDFSQADSPLNTLDLSLDMAILIRRDDNGIVRLIPAVLLDSQGATAPNAESVIIQVGNETFICPLDASSHSVDRTTVFESADFPLDSAVLGQLENARRDDVKIRICGTSKNYDLDFAGSVKKLRAFAAACKNLV